MNLKPNYFELNGDSGQTPSNTPSNKKGLGIQFNLDNLNFNSKIKNEENNESDEDRIQIENEFCLKLYLGKIPQGHYVNDKEPKSCSKLYCNRCNSKVNFIHGQKLSKGHDDQPHKLKEFTENDINFNIYCCKCTSKSLDNDCILLEKVGIDYWECDGHVKHI